MLETGLNLDWDFNLYNIILDLVNDGFIDSFFVRKARQGKAMAFGIIKDCLIPHGNPFPAAFVERSQVKTFGLDVESAFAGEGWNFYK